MNCNNTTNNCCNNNCNNSCNNSCGNDNCNCNNGCNNINNDSSVSPSSGTTPACCTGQTGCSWDGNINSLVLEPIYIQKMYDSALFNLQAIAYAQSLTFTPAIPAGSTIVGVSNISIYKSFDPTDTTSTDNFTIATTTTLQGAQFVQSDSADVTVVGPDGLASEKIIYVDTSCCDKNPGTTESPRGTPIFGSQTITVSGNVTVNMTVQYIDPNNTCGCVTTQNLTATYTIASPSGGSSITLNNFFELCLPSVYEGAFLPRFTELCNAGFTGRLMTNNLSRDITVSSAGSVSANLIIAICITCEKKILLPVQICVLSTGFTQVSPDSGGVCTTYPSLFPNSIEPQTSSGNSKTPSGSCLFGCNGSCNI